MMSENKHMDYEGSRVVYSVAGEGPAVMLVHGFGEDHRIWDQQAGFLSSNHTVILPDLPGSGRSGMIGKPGTGIDTYADCLRAILENERIKECVVLGHSMGGYVTLALAEKYPDILSGFGLVHSTAFADSEEKMQARRKGIEFIKTHGALEFLKTSIPGLFSDPLKNKMEIDTLIERAGGFSAEALCQYYEAMMKRHDRYHVVSKACIPFLLTAGVFDIAVPFNQSLQQSYMAENTEIHILRMSGHMGMLEEPGKCNLIFGSFLANPGIRRKKLKLHF